MNSKRRLWLTFLMSGSMFLCMIFDSETALHGAAEGINVCMQTIIPVLLPYIFLSSLLTGMISGIKIPLIRHIGRLCSIPAGAESIFLLGLLCGYPVGARLLAESYQKGELSRPAAKRMMSFCNNAGPSFILGILPFAFSIRFVPWLLWLIHTISAITVGMLIPSTDRSPAKIRSSHNTNPSVILLQTVKTLSLICGWVILFRILIALINEHFSYCLPFTIQVVLTGLLELANGCISLGNISNEIVRFIICSGILAFGGLCVLMQTSSVCGGLGMGMYCKGKILQTLISLVFALPVGYLVYDLTPDFWFFLSTLVATGVLILAVITYLKNQRKKCGNSVNVGI